MDWPGLEQVCRIERTTWRNGQQTVEVDYAITSVPREQGGASQLLTWWRGHWGIENRLHYVRDVAFGEDASRFRSGSGPQIMSALRNASISLLRCLGETNIAAALRTNSYQVTQLFAKLGIMKE